MIMGLIVSLGLVVYISGDNSLEIKTDDRGVGDITEHTQHGGVGTALGLIEQRHRIVVICDTSVL